MLGIHEWREKNGEGEEGPIRTDVGGIRNRRLCFHHVR